LPIDLCQDEGNDLAGKIEALVKNISGREFFSSISTSLGFMGRTKRVKVKLACPLYLASFPAPCYNNKRTDELTTVSIEKWATPTFLFVTGSAPQVPSEGKEGTAVPPNLRDCED
jgi:hypothetical protein